MHDELWASMLTKKQFTEKDAAYILWQMLSALIYLHNQGVVHRNIRPSNILVKEDGKWDIKLIDFDFAKVLPSGENFYLKQSGVDQAPPYYDAPEIFRGAYDEKCDLWSAGCILYILLSGQPPFQSKSGSLEDIIEQIQVGNVDLETNPVWRNVSSDAKDLVRQLLTYEPSERPSAEEAL